MYDYAKRAPAQAESVVKDAWKYSPSSSGAQKVLAALRSYGLIEDAPGTNGKSIKITPRSVRILLDEEDSVERREEIRKAALAPKWYEYCWKTWGREMPASMRSNLLIEHGFIDTTVDGFLKDYRKTIAFAGLLDEVMLGKSDLGTSENGNRFKPGDYVQWESQGILRMPAAKKLSHYISSPQGDFAFVEGSLVGIPVDQLVAAEPPGEEPAAQQQTTPPHGILIPATTRIAQGETKMQVETFALPEGVTGQLQWPSEMSLEAYDDFIYQLEGLKRRVNRAVKKDAGVSADGCNIEG
jgi:hypothetical protein